MNKNFSFRGLLLSSLVVLAAMLSSCSKSAYKKAIPADVPIVLELDVKNIGLKSDFLAQKDDIADLILSIDPEDADLKKLADMLRTPQDMGLDMLSPMYFFTPSSMEEGYILASVRDKETVAKKLATISEAVELSESGDITWVEEHGRLVAALTQKSLLLGSSNNRNDYRDLLENDKSFFSTDAGKFFKEEYGRYHGYDQYGEPLSQSKTRDSFGGRASVPRLAPVSHGGGMGETIRDTMCG